jgi:nicotinate-nucleotide adenylyltransferase
MKIGLYFGSFNPVHSGHLIIANHVANEGIVDQVWMVVSPHNPLKKENGLLNEYHRLHLIQLAIEGDTRLKASDIEFKLPRPSYTIDTLIYLKEKYPQHQFSIVMGSDGFQNLHKWKNFQTLVRDYEFIIYNRPGFTISETHGARLAILQAPMLDISATAIRLLIKEKKSVRYLLPEPVRKEIEENHYYR